LAPIVAHAVNTQDIPFLVREVRALLEEQQSQSSQ
jgi:hypothetical protein